MIVNVLLKSLGRPNIFMLFLWSSDSLISYKASVAQICVLFRLNDRQWSLSKPRSPKYVFFICCLWSSMISYKASVAQICVLFRLNDRQWSVSKPRSPKYFFLFVVYDRQWSLTKPQSCKYVSYLDSMISYKASVAQKCFLFDLYDRQWSLTKPRSPKYVAYLDSMIINDLLQSLGHPNMCLIEIQWSSKISYKASVAHICFLFVFLWSSMISYKASVA